MDIAHTGQEGTIPFSPDKDRKATSTSNIGYKIAFFITAIFALFIFFTFVCISLFGKSKGLHIYNQSKISNAFVILIASSLIVVFLYLITFHSQKMKPMSGIQKHLFYTVIGTVNTAVFILQLFIASIIRYTPKWDPIALLTYAQFQSTNRTTPQWVVDYFNQYPNNRFLAIVFKAITVAGNKAGFSNEQACVYISVLAVNATCLLIGFSILRLTENIITSLIGWVLSVLIIGFSGWIAVPYTDTFLLPFLASSILISVLLFKSSSLKKIVSLSLMLGILLGIGSLLKPTALIFGIALSLSIILAAIYQHPLIRFTAARIIPALIACLLISLSSTPIINSLYALPVDREKEFSISHYAMLGINQESLGIFNSEDATYSALIPGYDARKKADWDLTVRRYRDLTLISASKFFIKKNTMTYSDGTFGYGREGSDLPKPLKAPIPPTFSTVVKNLYYDSETSGHGLRGIQQILWNVVLLSCCLLAPGASKQLKKDTIQLPIMTAILTVLGLSIFLLIFESRGRYLFSFLPFYLVIGTYAIHNFSQFIQAKLLKSSPQIGKRNWLRFPQNQINK